MSLELTSTYIFALFFLTPFAHAQNSSVNNEVFRCPEHTVSQWSSTEVLKSRLIKNGYKIDKIYTTTGGCYEVLAKSNVGQAIKMQIDPVSLRALKTDFLNQALQN
ncbi:MAG: PepSY domain-containing protein [Pseudomonadota bacterium]